MISSQDPPESHREGFVLHPVFVNQNSGLRDPLCGARVDESLYQGITFIDACLEFSSEAIQNMHSRVKDAAAKVSLYHKIILPIKGAVVFKTFIYVITWLEYFALMETKRIFWDDEIAELAAFFSTWPVASALEQLLKQMDLLLADPARCLGSGRLGSVVPVLRREASQGTAPMALKVVEGDAAIRKLRDEYRNNKDVAAAIPGAVVRAIRLFEIEIPPCAGMLVEVGTRVSAQGPGNMRRALQAMSEVHRAGFRHGSARLDNLLDCGGCFSGSICSGRGGSPSARHRVASLSFTSPSSYRSLCALSVMQLRSSTTMTRINTSKRATRPTSSCASLRQPAARRARILLQQTPRSSAAARWATQRRRPRSSGGSESV